MHSKKLCTIRRTYGLAPFSWVCSTLCITRCCIGVFGLPSSLEGGPCPPRSNGANPTLNVCWIALATRHRGKVETTRGGEEVVPRPSLQHSAVFSGARLPSSLLDLQCRLRVCAHIFGPRSRSGSTHVLVSTTTVGHRFNHRTLRHAHFPS